MMLKGKIIRGDGWGRKMGYPTANLDRRYLRAHPVSEGVWVCRVRIGRGRLSVIRIGARRQHWLRGVAVIGVKDKVEVHIIDFDKNIYGWYGEAELVKKLRPLKKYKGTTQLVAQIKKDIAQARKILT